MTMFARLQLGLALALGASWAAAAPRDELHAAFGQFLAAKSFRASAIDVKKGTQISQVEFVAPDRYRIVANDRTSLIVGDTLYVDLGGSLQPMSVPGVGRMVAQYRNPQLLKEMESGMQVKALGEEKVDGEAARVYAYTVSQPVKADARAWVSVASGLPIQVESTGTFMGHTATTRVRYSGFNDPSIRIDAP